MSTLTVADPGRRDFLFLATGAMAAAGAAAVAWPLIDQMNPDASTAAGSSIEVDLCAHRRGSDRHRQISRRPAVHPAADGEGDRRRRRHQSRRTQGPADRRATRPEAGVVDRFGDLHPSRLRPDRPRRSLRGVVLPLPRLDLRRVGARARRTGAAEPAGARVHVPERHQSQDRLSQISPAPRAVPGRGEPPCSDISLQGLFSPLCSARPNQGHAVDAASVPDAKKTAQGLYLTADEVPPFLASHKGRTLFVDVRTPEELAASGVADAVDANAPVVVMSADGNRRPNPDFVATVASRLSAGGLPRRTPSC